MAKKQPESVTMRHKIGEDELEITGPPAYVEEKIAEFVAQHSQAQGDPPSKKRKQRRVRKNHKQPASESKANAVDITAIVNRLKDQENYTLIQDRVLHKKDLWNKMRMVFLLVDDYLTSGDIHKVIAALDVKVSLSSVSIKMKDMIGSLLTSAPRKAGGAPTRYKLSGPAKSSAQKWFNETLK
ncbi:MAG: hypothetical protein KAV00_04355 [Phycisphaerae bacterium]|nr:hypothetical protein [Phycisphaerae bacterium]